MTSRSLSWLFLAAPLMLALAAPGCVERRGDDDDDDSEGDDDDDSSPMLAVTIISPTAGAELEGGNQIPIAAELSGADSADEVSWNSSVDGDLGSDLAFSTQLSAGQHTLSVDATVGGETVSDSIDFTVVAPPFPFEGNWNGNFSFTASSVIGSLTCPGSLSFAVDADGFVLGTGTCTDDTFGETVSFDLDGQVGESGSFSGAFTIEGVDGSLQTDGTFTGNSASGSFDQTTGDGAELTGSWSASR